jgi:TIR domain/Bacterial SH3 domain
MAGHVFISHAHQDRASAEQLLAALESRGIKCWSAPRDVAPGGSYAESILRGIESAGCFVLVFTQHSNLSPHVLREVERALNLGINIIPVRFDDSGVSKSLDYLLATVHWLSATSEPRARALEHAVEKIAWCVAAGDPSLVAPAFPAGANVPVVLPKSAAPRSGRQFALWICLALLAAAVAALAFLLLRHPTGSTDVAAKNESNRVPIATPSVVPPSSSVAPASARDSAQAASPQSAATKPPSSRYTLVPAVQVKGVIRDPDGYSNVREVASLQSRVIGTAQDGETVVVFGKERDWVKVSLANGTVGYIHESRIRMNR